MQFTGCDQLVKHFHWLDNEMRNARCVETQTAKGCDSSEPTAIPYTAVKPLPLKVYRLYNNVRWKCSLALTGGDYSHRQRRGTV